LVSREVFITHLHEDHLSLKQFIAGARLKFYTGERYVKPLERKYSDLEIPVEEYRNVLVLHHCFMHSETGKIRETETYGFFIKDSLGIPECDEPAKLIEEYKLKTLFLFIFY